MRPLSQRALADDGSPHSTLADQLAPVVGLHAKEKPAAVDFDKLCTCDERLPDRRRAPMTDADLVADGGVAVGRSRSVASCAASSISRIIQAAMSTPGPPA